MNEETNLELIETREEERQLIEAHIRRVADSRNEPIDILEAGCGRKWPFKMTDVEYVLTGIDMDKAALEIRANTLADLHKTIEGDLCTIELSENQYDVIYCSFVLEHVERADLVLRNFSRWVKPNGIVIIRVPDFHSVKGFVTRYTPFWFHVYYHRLVLGQKSAGKPGFSPYQTFYNPVISRNGMRQFCGESAIHMAIEEEYGDGYVKPGRGIVKAMISAFVKSVSFLSFGNLSHKHTNLLYILRSKPLRDTA